MYDVMINEDARKEIRREWENFLRDLDSQEVPKFLYHGQPCNFLELVYNVAKNEWHNTDHSFVGVCRINCGCVSPHAQELDDTIVQIAEEYAESNHVSALTDDAVIAKQAYNRIASSFYRMWKRNMNTNMAYKALVDLGDLIDSEVEGLV